MYDDNGVPLFRNGNSLGRLIASISRPYDKQKPQPHHGDIKVYKPDPSGVLILSRVISIINRHPKFD